MSLLVTTAALLSTDIQGEKKAVISTKPPRVVPPSVLPPSSDAEQLQQSNPTVCIQRRGAKSLHGVIPASTLAVSQTPGCWERTCKASLPDTSAVVRTWFSKGETEAAQKGCGSLICGDPQDSGRHKSCQA